VGGRNAFLEETNILCLIRRLDVAIRGKPKGGEKSKMNALGGPSESENNWVDKTAGGVFKKEGGAEFGPIFWVSVWLGKSNACA